MQMNFTTNFGNRPFHPTTTPPMTMTNFQTSTPISTNLVNPKSFVLRDKQSLINRSLSLGIIINSKNQSCLSCSGAK